MAKLPVIDDFIHYNKDVGPLQMLIVGYPGTGKSNQATGVLIECLARPHETALMHGDITCEWKHYLRYSKYLNKITVLIPEGIELHKNLDNLNGNYKVPYELKEIDFNKLNILEHLQENELTVVYDDCFTSESKTYLWKEIARQLVTRTSFLDTTITYLCHEAGNYYPQLARTEQWAFLDEFCEYFVYFRKMKIRAMLLTQLETEVYDRVRKKCIWKSYRICYPTSRTHARQIKKYILKMEINNYNLFYGDMFNPLCSNQKTKEIKEIALIVPRHLIKLSPAQDHLQEKNSPKKLRCEFCGHIWLPKTSNPLSCPRCKQYFGYSVTEESYGNPSRNSVDSYTEG